MCQASSRKTRLRLTSPLSFSSTANATPSIRGFLLTSGRGHASVRIKPAAEAIIWSTPTAVIYALRKTGLSSIVASVGLVFEYPQFNL